jgi:hypothetical protein
MPGMHRTKSFAILAALSAVVLATPLALAWQSYAVSGDGAVFIQNPQRSSLYRRTLVGETQVFEFQILGAPERVQVQLFLPDYEGAAKDVRAALVAKGDDATPLAEIDSASGTWTEKFMDTQSQLAMLVGPKIEERIPAGDYEIRVWSPNNDSSYAIGMGRILEDAAAEQAPTSPEPEPREVSSNLRSAVIALIVASIGLSIWFARRKKSA